MEKQINNTKTIEAGTTEKSTVNGVSGVEQEAKQFTRELDEQHCKALMPVEVSALSKRTAKGAAKAALFAAAGLPYSGKALDIHESIIRRRSN